MFPRLTLQLSLQLSLRLILNHTPHLFLLSLTLFLSSIHALLPQETILSTSELYADGLAMSLRRLEDGCVMLDPYLPIVSPTHPRGFLCLPPTPTLDSDIPFSDLLCRAFSAPRTQHRVSRLLFLPRRNRCAGYVCGRVSLGLLVFRCLWGLRWDGGRKVRWRGRVLLMFLLAVVGVVPWLSSLYPSGYAMIEKLVEVAMIKWAVATSNYTCLTHHQKSPDR
ncbi:hypothetical protein KCU69_g7, partial [Aureobasidium melanogenum]